MRQVQAYLDEEGYVVEQGGSLRTGPFKDAEAAKEWYARELEIELEVEDGD